MKNTITEVKKKINREFQYWTWVCKTKISEIKDKSFEISQLEKQKEKRMEKRELLGTITCMNIHIMGVPEGERKEKGEERKGKKVYLNK